MLFGAVASQFHSNIRECFPDMEIVHASRRDASSLDYSEITCVLGWRFPAGIFGKMPNLRWIQSVSVGVEDWVFDPTIRPGVLISNAKGVYADPVAEYVIWSLLTLSRRFHTNIRNQARRRWIQTSGDGLRNKVLGIAGLGSIGKAIAFRARAFDMRIVGIVRDPSHPNLPSHVDEIIPFSNMESVLNDLDALVLCLPLTDQTRDTMSRQAIDKMKRGAIIVNVAREGIVDYSGLCDALKDGRLGGAALDVFEKEPLKPWSRLWKLDNLLITPHISAFTKDYKMRVADLICDNIHRFASEQTLRGMVDRTTGY